MKKCPYCGAEYPDDTAMCPVDHTPLDPPLPSAKVKHSGLGIASFSVSIAVGCLIVVLICVAGVLSAHRDPGERHYPGQIVVGFAMIFLLAADVVALGLGIAALFQTGKNRVFGILGLVFSASAIIGTLLLMLVGLMYLRSMAGIH